MFSAMRSIELRAAGASLTATRANCTAGNVFATVIAFLGLAAASDHCPERSARRRHRYALWALNPSRPAYSDIFRPELRHPCHRANHIALVCSRVIRRSPAIEVRQNRLEEWGYLTAYEKCPDFTHTK